ncbi:uncharacterized protein LOC122664668 [Telopea speciosissima]|uniref:uncharacterized protein LOC122664668 n=1 Tax=Telopea speciosissima TaxID=54955 RepID=UPI001CC62FC1|nr:uncharacterized protein LOC122664668 [Telopea speciosissima]
MDSLNAPILSKTGFYYRIPAFRPKSFSTNRCKKYPLKSNQSDSTLFLKTQFSCPPICSNGVKSRIWSQFGRATRRQNYLRKKLTEQQQQVRDIRDSSNLQTPNGISTETNLNFSDSNENSSGFIEGDIVESDIVTKPKLISDSVVWSKLENWVDQYTKDPEFWGIGSGPIFTVFEDLDGNVERVLVDEGEILRRSRIETRSFGKPELKDHSTEVNLKISGAKRLARDIETGNYKISKSSSIAKFVVSCKRSSLVGRLLSVALQPNLSRKVSRLGFATLCGSLMFCAIRRVLRPDNDVVELSREEKEMLRRKMKSRMEKEEMMASTVEVLPNALEPVIERPPLDKQELMNRILKAKESKDKLTLLDSASTLTSKADNFDDKIQEIRGMARRARQLEQQQSSSFSRDEEENEVVKENIHNGMKEGKSQEEVVSFPDSLSDGDSEKPGCINGTISSLSVNDSKEEDTGFLGEFSFGDFSKKSETYARSSSMETTEDGRSSKWVPEEKECTSHLLDVKEVMQSDMENKHSKGDSWNPLGINGTLRPTSVDEPKTEDSGFLGEVSSGDATECTDSGNHTVRSMVVSETGEKNTWDLEKSDKTIHSPHMKEVMQSHDTNDTSNSLDKISIGMKPKVIRSVKEAREYLSQKRAKRKDDLEPQVRNLQKVTDNLIPAADQDLKDKKGLLNYKNNSMLETSMIDDTPGLTSIKNACEDSTLRRTGVATDISQSLPVKVLEHEDVQEKNEVDDLKMFRTSQDSTGSDCSTEAPLHIDQDSWMEKNFQEFEPIVSKIRVGFRENYMVAKEKGHDESLSIADITQLGSNDDDSEFEWMKDDGLKEIVFQVRENELAGRDPFHLMDADDKHAFFKGLERKVEIENAKLLNLHEWIHSRVENIDYGTDGISLYDPPEKIMPRWKGPPVDKDPEFLNNFSELKKSVVARNMGHSHPMNEDAQDTLQKSEKSLSSDDISTSSPVCEQRKISQGGVSAKLKTVIESSDGSIRAGKKSGKEYWQHTKKWSREFLEAYNAETDPEIKSVMKDMGKDLDRWITEEEIQEAADLMTRIPKKKRRYIEKKLNRLKREMEMFGPQAVVSKYREHAEEKEEDYLWWLDLPCILCIELYTVQDGVQKVGFYSLEMAGDLELDPKQYHVIAFEDAGDSKNLCYIIQAHMEMLGNGHAFVVARPPKDAFREAKADGFNVTVIRKGELQLNVDQTLEEVEEEISEIGSKMYHDKIMRERSVDIGSLMKGVFGSSKSTKRQRSKPKLKEPTKH